MSQNKKLSDKKETTKEVIITEQKKSIRGGKKREHYCLYCDTLVLNFSRHLVRHHKAEVGVQKIINLPVGSKERKELLISLRKKGDYIISMSCPKPIKTPSVSSSVLPCNNCYGFYSAKQLWRHKKYCLGGSQKFCQSKAQNFLLKKLSIDLELKESVSAYAS